MEIRELYLKHFGKFTNERVIVKSGINVCYGENEFGKTTIYEFLKSMLFGMERGRGRASKKDIFSLYEPWDNPNFYGGVLRFETGERNFHLERQFDRYGKMAKLICEDDGEVLSILDGDLEMLLEGMSKSDFENTVAIGQMKAETNKSLAESLAFYSINYYTTGNCEIDFLGALGALKKRKKELLCQIKDYIAKKNQQREMIEQEISFVFREVEKISNEIEEQNSFLEQEVTLKKRWNVFPISILLTCLCLIIIMVFLKRPWDVIGIVTVIIMEGLLIWYSRKKANKVKEDSFVVKQEWKKDHLTEELKEKQILLYNLQEKGREIEEIDDEYKSFLKREKALTLAMDKISILSKEVTEDFGITLNRKASSILSVITKGKYNSLRIDENLEISLYKESQCVQLIQVSRGTIEQIYFALRMAAFEVLYGENFPIVLDDAFVFYDEERLKQTLVWLESQDRQVLLFTCQKRELELLKKLEIPYNKVAV